MNSQDSELFENSGQTQSALSSNDIPQGVVGIAFSADSLESLKKLLAGLPSGQQLAFILCPDESVSADTTLENSLQNQTKQKIVRLSESAKFHADQVYWPPHEGLLTFSEKTVSVDTQADDKSRVALAETVFASISESWLDKCVGVVLSGAYDGAVRGAESILSRDGCAIFETTSEGQFTIQNNLGPDSDGEATPLQISQIPEAIRRHFDSRAKSNVEQEVHAEQESDDYGSHILRHLFSRFKTDFSEQRQPELHHILLARLQDLGIEEVSDYYDRLLVDPDEAETLHESFFGMGPERTDPSSALDVLESKVIKPLIEECDEESSLRIWMPACGNGAEAYTLIIRIIEVYKRLGREPKFKIFATDMHKEAIRQASAGDFTEDALERFDPDLRNQHFKPRGKFFRVNSETRNFVVFAEQNLISDPPFARIDLIVCRNILFNFKPALQRRIIESFNFALKPDAFLFLGQNESPEGFDEGFSLIDTPARILRKKGHSKANTWQAAHEWKTPKKREIKRVVESIQSPVLFSNSQVVQRDLKLNRSMLRLIEKTYGQSLLIDDKLNLIHTFGDCDPYILAPRGRQTLRITSLINPDLKSALNSALNRARTEMKRCVFNRIEFQGGTIRMIVDPLFENEKDDLYTSIRFEKEVVVESESLKREENTLSSTSNDVRKIEEELLNTRGYLESTIEEFETSNETLQQTNEELLSANEELQSTNEELHSVNEELFTVNAEYKQKNDELTRLNADFDQLLENTKIGTVFLDFKLRIRKYTPVAAGTLNLIKRDIGRPINHINPSFANYTAFTSDIEKTSSEHCFIEREVKAQNETTYLLRISPYEKQANGPSSVVITLIDISQLKKAEASISEHQKRLTMAEELAKLGTWDWDINSDQITVDTRFAAVSGLKLSATMQASKFFDEIDCFRTEPTAEEIKSKINAKDSIDYYWALNFADGTRRFLRGYGAVTRDDYRNPTHFRGIITDDTELKLQEEFVLQQRKDMETLLYVISHDLREPLRSIRNFSKFLDAESHNPDHERTSDFLSRIMRASERMDSLLNEVGVLSRLKRASDPLETVTGNELVESALRNLENRIEQTGAKVIVAKDLPNLRVHKTWAKQAIFNLVANALKFVKEDAAPDILITPYAPAGIFSRHVGITVQDRGPGVPKESEEHIFKLFQRAVGKDIEGTGAGLAIVKEVAVKHGGDVYYEPRKMGGSKFTITFQKFEKTPDARN